MFDGNTYIHYKNKMFYSTDFCLILYACQTIVFFLKKNKTCEENQPLQVGTALYITTFGRTRCCGPMAMSKRYTARCQVFPMVLMQALKTKALEGSLKGLPGGVEKNNKGG